MIVQGTAGRVATIVRHTKHDWCPLSSVSSSPSSRQHTSTESRHLLPRPSHEVQCVRLGPLASLPLTKAGGVATQVKSWDARLTPPANPCMDPPSLRCQALATLFLATRGRILSSTLIPPPMSVWVFLTPTQPQRGLASLPTPSTIISTCGGGHMVRNWWRKSCSRADSMARSSNPFRPHSPLPSTLEVPAASP